MATRRAPDKRYVGATEQHGLREGDEMRGRADRLHHVLQPDRHALHRGAASRKQLRDHHDRHREQSELAHRRRQRAEQNAESRDHESVNRCADEEQQHRTCRSERRSRNAPRTCNDSSAATRMTRPLANIFASMISAGTTGITSKCSTVPCSRSRISAAPVRITVSSVIWLMTCVMAENQAVFKLGLNLARTTRLIGTLLRLHAPR